MIAIVIPGEPTGKGRPRLGRYTTYTPKKTVEYENKVKRCYESQGQGISLDGAIKANIFAYYGIPKSKSKKLKEQMGSGAIRPTKKPDIDNIAKAVLDSLNGLAYKDDSQIVSLHVEKYYSETPRVEVQLNEND